MTAVDPLARALGEAVKATDLGAVTVDELAARLAATARAFDDRPYLTAPEAVDRAARALSMDDGSGPDHYDTAAVGSPRRQDLRDRALLILGAAMGTVSLEEIAAHHGYYPDGRIGRLSAVGVDNPVASVILHHVVAPDEEIGENSRGEENPPGWHCFPGTREVCHCGDPAAHHDTASADGGR